VSGGALLREELLALLGLPRIRRQDYVELAPALGEGVVLLIKVRLGLGLAGLVGECPLEDITGMAECYSSNMTYNVTAQ
jgi:hypothetical protein